jgi:oxalate decarboxylase/phosphoglucose isomerase-like protein (cupin superfamily)
MASSEAFIVQLNDKPDYQRILEGKPQTCGMRSGRVFLESGKACGQHSTKDHEELLVFLSGQGELLIGDPAQAVTSLQVEAGRLAYIPPRTLHDVHNTGNAPLVYIYCVAPVELG